MRAVVLARLGALVAAVTFMGCSDGDDQMFPDGLAQQGDSSGPEGASATGGPQLATAQSMPAELRIAAIRAAQENASARYDFERVPAASAEQLIGHNAAQRVAVEVDVQGVHLADTREDPAGVGWRLGLRLGQVCRASSCTTMVAADAALDASHNRTMIRHVGGVEEWYLNGPLGVEQGFTIQRQPFANAERQPEPLVLKVAVGGDLVPRLQSSGQEARLVDRRGVAVLRYTDFYARDASGRLLRTAMAVEENDIALTVFDADARYPIEVDPLVWSEMSILAASDPEDSDHFGFSSTMDGTTAVVGAPHENGAGTDRGAVYVFERDYPTNNAWGQRGKLVPNSFQDGETFGWAVSLSGDTLVVGAPFINFFGDQTAPGRVYVFERNHPSQNAWGRTAIIEPSVSSNGFYFGTAVGVSGDTVVAGAWAESSGGYRRGAAYVFDRGLGGADAWGQRTRITLSGAVNEDQFGFSVAISGDVAIVCARGRDGAGTDRGAAYVHERNLLGTNAWGRRATLLASDPTNNANFGHAVAISGELAVVGGVNDAYLFEHSYPAVDAWGERTKLDPSDLQAGSGFGSAVAISGDEVVVGAWGADEAGTDSGAAYGFGRDVNGQDEWGELAKLTASNGAALDRFGTSVAVSAAGAIVGAQTANGSGSDQGAAYVYVLRLTDGEPCSGPSQCVSGFCIDDVCCATDCAGGTDDCTACSIAQGGAVDGVCGPSVDGAPCDDGWFCTMTDSCTGGACGGTGDPCTAEVGDADSDCSESCNEGARACTAEDPDGSACEDGVYCNGADSCVSGVCSGASGDPCPGPDDDAECAESCDEAAASCTANDPDGSSCADGARACQSGACIGSAGEECTDGDQCDTTYCVDDICCTESDCTPYRCGPAGDCRSTCTMSAECASGFHCDGTGRCIADAAPAGGSTDEEGGCSCRLNSHREGRGGLLVALGGLAMLGLRRRQRA